MHQQREVKKPMSKYTDCNEQSWQTRLWIHGEAFYFSNRVAWGYLNKETDELRAARQAP